MIKKANGAMTFFNSLPDTQPDVEEYKIKADAVVQAKQKAADEAKLKADLGYDMKQQGPPLMPLLSKKKRVVQGPNQASQTSRGGRRSRKKNNRNKKRVKTLNKKKYRSSRTRRFRSKNKK
jgi:hypothetical protein